MSEPGGPKLEPWMAMVLSYGATGFGEMLDKAGAEYEECMRICLPREGHAVRRKKMLRGAYDYKKRPHHFVGLIFLQQSRPPNDYHQHQEELCIPRLSRKCI